MITSNAIQNQTSEQNAQSILNNAVAMQQQVGQDTVFAKALEPAVAAAYYFLQGKEQNDPNTLGTSVANASDAIAQLTSALVGRSVPVGVRVLCETLITMLGDIRRSALIAKTKMTANAVGMISTAQPTEVASVSQETSTAPEPVAPRAETQEITAVSMPVNTFSQVAQQAHINTDLARDEDIKYDMTYTKSDMSENPFGWFIVPPVGMYSFRYIRDNGQAGGGALEVMADGTLRSFDVNSEGKLQLKAAFPVQELEADTHKKLMSGQLQQVRFRSLPGISADSFGIPTDKPIPAGQQAIPFGPVDPRKMEALKAFTTLSAEDLADCLRKFAEKSGFTLKPAGESAEAYALKIMSVQGENNLINMAYDILIDKVKQKEDEKFAPLGSKGVAPNFIQPSLAYKAQAKALPPVGYNGKQPDKARIREVLKDADSLTGQQLVNALMVFAAATGAFSKDPGENPEATGKLILIKYGEGGLADLAQAVLRQAKDQASVAPVVVVSPFRAETVAPTAVAPLIQPATPQTSNVAPDGPAEPKKKWPVWAVPAGIGALALLVLAVSRSSK